MGILFRRAPRARWPHRSLLGASVLVMLVMMTIAGCGGAVVVRPPVGGVSSDDPSAAAGLALRGDPTFGASDLGVSQRARYYDVMDQLANPRDSHVDPFRMADKDDLWWYGHYLQTHVQAVLHVFRMTGDLALLDHVDELAEIMRSHLRDSWRDTKDGTDGTSDGYLNWVMRMSGGGDDNYGKDTHIAYDLNAHAAVAMIAYALHNNRDLASPKGYDYGEHADFWRDYLVDHFVAKVRSRHGSADGSWPIVDWYGEDWPPQVNSALAWVRFHYYMAQLLDDDAYLAEAGRLSDKWLTRLVPCGTPAGTAYVFHRNDPAHSASYRDGLGNYLSATTYAEWAFSFAVDLHLEGFRTWSDPVLLERFGRTVTQYVMGDADIFDGGLYGDVGGERSRCGIPTRNQPTRTDVAPAPHRFTYMSLPWLAAWDETDAILSLSTSVLDYADASGWDTVNILVGLMLDTHLRPAPSGTASTAR